jgi:hypothetical protein
MSAERRHLERCPACREASEPVGAALRSLPVPEPTAAERARLWQAIQRGGAAPRGSRPGTLAARMRGAVRRQPMFAWAAAAAAVVLLVLAPLQIGQERRVFSQAQLNAMTVIEHVEAARAPAVVVLRTPTERISVIWVVEPEALGDLE